MAHVTVVISGLEERKSSSHGVAQYLTDLQLNEFVGKITTTYQIQFVIRERIKIQLR